MDPDPEIKTEIKEELTEAIEIVNCDMAVDETHFEENPLNEEHDSLAITDVQLSTSASHITKLCPEELLVYTTRLDDMQIWWNNLDAMYVEEVTESIIKESKPKYTGYFENTKPVDQQRRTFSSLKDQIEEINCLPSCKVVESIHAEKEPITLSKRSKALLRACKPLSIVLQDCMKNEAYVKVDESPNFPENVYDIYRDFTVTNIALTPKVEEDDFSRHIRENMTNNTPYYVILKDLNSEASDIYFINNDIKPSEYYKLNSKNEQSHYINPKSTVMQVEIESCCWYKREQRIKELSAAVNFQATFMKTQHTCAPDLCKCCCKKKRNNGETPSVYFNQPPIRLPKREKMPYDLSQNSIWQDNLLNRCRSVNKWIDKALKYKATPRHKDRKTIHGSDNDVDTILQIEHAFVDGLKSSFYYIASPNVSVKTLLELDGALNLTEKNILYYIEKIKSRSSTHACCWCRYNMFLSELTSSYPPNVVKFMRKPHKCAPRKCVCCCKLKASFTEKVSSKLVPIVFPSHLKYASSYCKKIQQRTSKLISTPDLNISTCNVVTICNITQTVSKVIEKPSVTLAAVHNTITGNKIPTISNVTEQPTTTRPLATKIYSPNVTPTNSKKVLVTPPVTVSKTDTHNITQMTNVIDRPITSSAISQTDSQYGLFCEPDCTIDTKLNELQGLSIVLHSDNTVTADLEGTPNKLSTENLKILKILLQRADTFMKSRKFASTAPMRVSNIFSSAKKKISLSIGVVEFPTIVLDDDDDSSCDIASSSVSQAKKRPKKTQSSGSQLTTGSSVMQFQEQFVKNIEMMSSDSASPTNQSEHSAPPIPSQDQYEVCTNTLYEKRVQYYNSILSLLNSGNENLSLNLNVPLIKSKDQDLASCIVDFQCFKNKIIPVPHSEPAQKRKANNDKKLVSTEKKMKKDSNITAISSPINATQLSQLPFRTITLPPGVKQITNFQGTLPTDSKGITLIPVTFVDPQSGKPIGNIPLSLLSQPIAGNATDMTMKPIEPAQGVQSINPLGNVVVIPPAVDNQTQTAPHSDETPNKNILLSRLLAGKTESSLPDPRQMISVESEDNIITGIIRNEESNEDVSILGV